MINKKIAVFAFLTMLSCALFENEQKTRIENLDFSKSENYITEGFQNYRPNQPLVLLSMGVNIPNNAVAIAEVASKSGDTKGLILHTIHNISSSNLNKIIQDHDGQAVVTIKDPEKKKAYDPQRGYVTSGQTVAEARNFFETTDGVEVLFQITAAPVFALQLDDDSFLLEKIRKQGFVQIVEPNFGLRRLKARNASVRQNNQELTALLGVIETSTTGSKGLKTLEADTIQAIYVQPSGDTLKTTTTINNQ